MTAGDCASCEVWGWWRGRSSVTAHQAEVSRCAHRPRRPDARYRRKGGQQPTGEAKWLFVLGHWRLFVLSRWEAHWMCWSTGLGHAGRQHGGHGGHPACSALEHVELAGSSDRAVGAEGVPPSGQVGSGKRRRPHPRARAQRAAQRVRRRTGVVALQHAEGVPPSGQVESEALADSQGHAVPSTCSEDHGGLDDG